MKTIKVGIIGYGLSGRIFHGLILKEVAGFEVISVCTKDVEKQRQAKQDFPKVKITETPEDMIADSEVELVIVSTPNTSHADLAESAMRAGKHVIVEKPFTVTLEEAVRLMVISQETGQLISVYQNRRFDSDFKTLQKIIESGEVGKIVEFESHFDRFRPEKKINAWREEAHPGSGTLYDLGSHLIDQALVLFGLPDEVYGDFASQRNGVVEDQFEIILYYNQLKVTLKAGNLVKEPLPRFILLGDEGAFVKYGLDVQEGALREGLIPTDEMWGVEPESQYGVLNTQTDRKVIKSEKGDYRTFYRAIFEAISEGKSLPVTAEEGANVIKIIEAVILSQREKRRIEL